MDSWIYIAAGLVGLLLLGVFAYRLIRRLEHRDHLRSLIGQRYAEGSEGDETLMDRDGNAITPEDEFFSRLASKKSKLGQGPTLEERMFRAGMFSEEQRSAFRRDQILWPCVLVLAFGGIGATFGEGRIFLMFVVVGGLLGAYIPLWMLDRRMNQRTEEILFYLPLVIEQIAIGVSSSLDIGPCLARVVQMANERQSHNPVTELLRFAQGYVKSGVSLQDALNEVGRQSGSNDVKHAFKALAQVARYGGEISKQLQDLSEAVSSARETQIEGKIKKLELKATAPVGLVFLGYIVILLTGFGMMLLKAL